MARRGLPVGRPRVYVCRDLIAQLRNEGVSWRKIAARLGAGVGTVRRAYKAVNMAPGACQNPIGAENSTASQLPAEENPN